MGSNFEMELAQMDGIEGGEALVGEGPENQLTNIKWVKIFSLISLTCSCMFV